MEEKVKVPAEDQALAEEIKGFTDMDINSDADIPGSTHLSNPEPENAVEKLQSDG